MAKKFATQPHNPGQGGTCPCGCQKYAAKGKTYLPGHDARLASQTARNAAEQVVEQRIDLETALTTQPGWKFLSPKLQDRADKQALGILIKEGITTEKRTDPITPAMREEIEAFDQYATYYVSLPEDFGEYDRGYVRRGTRLYLAAHSKDYGEEPGLDKVLYYNSSTNGYDTLPRDRGTWIQGGEKVTASFHTGLY